MEELFGLAEGEGGREEILIDCLRVRVKREKKK